MLKMKSCKLGPDVPEDATSRTNDDCDDGKLHMDGRIELANTHRQPQTPILPLPRHRRFAGRHDGRVQPGCNPQHRPRRRECCQCRWEDEPEFLCEYVLG